MRSIIPILLISVFHTVILAQSLQFVSPQKSLTATYLNDAHIRLNIKNISSSPVSVKVKRIPIEVVPEHISYFCWTACYEPVVSESPTSETIAAGGTIDIFEASLSFERSKRDKNIGVSVIRYCFFNEKSPSDSICIDLTFNITAPKSSIVLRDPQLVATHSYEEDGEAKISIENFSSSPITVKTTMKKISGPASHLPYMCFTNCYTPEVFESPDTETLAPGTINDKFIGHLNVAVKSDDAIGKSVVKFCFVNVNNTSDSVCADVIFNVTKATGLEDGSISINGMKISPAYPNPASDFVNINYSMPLRVERAYLEVFSSIGRTIRTETLDPYKQSIKLDVSNFKPGIYFYRVVVNGRRSATRRFVVR